MVWKKVFLTWLLFIPVAIINGLVRQSVYQGMLGELRAHQLSTVIACVLFLFLAKKIMPDMSQIKKKDLFKIGFIWVFLTILFEFGFGHFIAGHSWEHLLVDYNIFQGRVWTLFLGNLLIAPWFIAKISKNSSHRSS